MDSPCRYCTDRHVGCHSECDRYTEYKEILNKKKEVEYMENLKPAYKKPVPANKHKYNWRKKIKGEE